MPFYQKKESIYMPNKEEFGHTNCGLFLKGSHFSNFNYISWEAIAFLDIYRYPLIKPVPRDNTHLRIHKT